MAFLASGECVALVVLLGKQWVLVQVVQALSNKSAAPLLLFWVLLF